MPQLERNVVMAIDAESDGASGVECGAGVAAHYGNPFVPRPSNKLLSFSFHPFVGVG